MNVRIGVDACCWANRRGYGRFAREIVPAMAALAPDDEFICFLDPVSAQVFAVESPNMRRVIVSGLSAIPARAASDAGHRTLADMFQMTRAVAAEKLDVFFSPSVYTFFPVPPGLPLVVTVHDAIPERFPSLVFRSKRARFFWWLKTKAALMQARSVLTVSDYAAAEIVAMHHVSAARISVATEAPSADYRPRNEPSKELADLPPGSRWFTYVGGFSRHKNSVALVEAHAALARELSDDPPYLLLVGTTSHDDFYTDVPAVRDAITREGTGALVRWTGFLDDVELSRIHTHNIALVLPSESEGFGLPAVEAAACGSPVIATTASPLPKLLDGAGIFVDPHNHAALLSAMRSLATDSALHASCSRAALARAGELTWSAGASAALAAIRRAAA